MDSDITNRTVFVVRNAGEKLNEARMDCYIRAAREIIQQYPQNQVTGMNQELTIQSPTNFHQGSQIKLYSQVVNNRNRKPRGRIYRGRQQYAKNRGRGNRGRGTNVDPGRYMRGQYTLKNQQERVDVVTYTPKAFEENNFRHATPYNQQTNSQSTHADGDVD